MKLRSSLLMIASIIIMLSGCTTTAVRDYDGENISEEEKQRMMDDGGIHYVQEDSVELIEDKGIVITAEKMNPILTIHNDYEVVQDKWNITAHNMTDKDVCVTLHWKLMDYRLISEQPSEFHVLHDSLLKVGTMVQQVWEIQGVRFTPEGSGYVAGMLIREPVEDALQGDECTFYELEEDIVER